MTEKANPSINRPAEAFKTAGAIAYGGHGGDGFVVDGANPTDIAVQDGGILEADLNAFAQTSGGASLDVTIDGGEAFVFGSWLAIDTDTTVTLAASTAGQTVYVGWNKNGADDVIVGLASDFSSASGDTDERIPLWTFDTDGSGVTNVVDERRIGYTQEATTFTGSIDLDDNSVNNANNILGSNGSSIDFQFGGSNDTALETQGSDIVLYDTANSVRLLSAQEGGTISLRANIDFLDSDSILDNGTTAISFDGSQNVTIANGNLNLSGQAITNATIQNFDYDGVTEPRIFFNDADGDTAMEIGYLIRGSGSDTSDDALRFRDAFNGVDILTLENGGYINAHPSERLGLPTVSTDPAATPGDIWYRSDLD